MSTIAPSPRAAASLPRSTPEQQGISSTALQDFTKAVDEQVHHVHSFMLVRHGAVLTEAWWYPYEAQQPHVLFSLTKSFTSTAVGLAISEGKFSLDDAVISFFPDEAPANPSANLRQQKVRHLLMMGSGHSKDPTGQMRSDPDGDWIRGVLACDPDLEPGSRFVYNSSASHLLSAIVQKVTGSPLREYLTPRLFAPLAIETPVWETCPKGRNTGGWGLSLKTEDIAKFGQLYLSQGRWNGRQIIPADWVRQATSRQIASGPNPNIDWNQGYGFQFWRCQNNAFRGDGAFGQYCLVMPDQDAVLAITAGLGNMQRVLDLVWQHLRPAMNPTALVATPRAHDVLLDTIAGLSLPTAAGATMSPTAKRISGRTYQFDKNELGLEAITLRFKAEGCEISRTINGVVSQMTAKHGEWQRQVSDGKPVAASFAWAADDTLKCLSWDYATPFGHTLSCVFAGDDVTLTIDQNVSFGPTRFGPFTGKSSRP